jgi:C-terminal processing protease CtpA/Prc
VVDLGLADGSTLQVSVPKLKGWPTPKEQRVHTKEPDANCTCLELAEDVGYIRIKLFIGHPADVLLKRNIKRERKQIRAFLERSRGYGKLIVDVRNNGGGDPAYWYENLVCPFLDQPVTYRHTAGLKRQFLKDTKPSVLRQMRKFLVQEYVIDTKEVAPAEGFDSDEWVFYEITRQLEPSQRFLFKGDMYVLINGGCYSACDDYAQTVKRIGMATLVGQTTGGCGGIGYCMNSLVRLPKSEMMFVLDVHLPLNPNGSFTALHGLDPDIELPGADPPKSITKEDLLKDEWIKWILADAQECEDRVDRQ